MYVNWYGLISIAEILRKEKLPNILVSDYTGIVLKMA